MFNEQIIEKVENIETQFDRLVQDFEIRINQLDERLKQFAKDNCYEIINAFKELKTDLRTRLLKVEEKNLEAVPQALAELNKLFNVMAEILENELVNYQVKNKFGTKQNLIATSLQKRIVDPEKQIY